MRAKTNIVEIAADLVRDLAVVRQALTDQANSSDAWATVETFCAVALRVMAKTNPSKIREAAMTVEIQHLMPGRAP